jgi:hypothetical protein
LAEEVPLRRPFLSPSHKRAGDVPSGEDEEQGTSVRLFFVKLGCALQLERGRCERGCEAVRDELERNVTNGLWVEAVTPTHEQEPQMHATTSAA